MNREGRIYTITFSFIVTFVFVLFLALLNASTLQRIQENEQLFKVRAILKAFGIEYDDKQALQSFEKNVKVKRLDNMELYYTHSGTKTLYGIVFSGSGLW
ncbi:MAG: FMN-binding protein, partial [Pseudothermotoga sp.]